MSHSIHAPRLLVLLLIGIALLPLLIVPAHGAEPGAELVSFSGTLDSGVPSRLVPLSESGPANLRLAVGGGSASDSVALSLLDSASTVLRSWVARSGETIWGAADLPPGAKLRVQTSGAALAFDLQAYARSTVLMPTAGVESWSGVVLGAGSETGESDIQLVAPAAGLYRFSMAAASGGFQLVVDENRVRKTVVSGQAPAADDSIYFLPAGSHSFSIVPDPSAGVATAWSLQLATAGTSDSLPASENAAVLGGGVGGGVFVEEWVPLQLDAARPVNIRIAAVGAGSDRLQVELRNGGEVVYTSPPISGGEIVWATSQLALGPNALRVVANGNNAPLAYSITVSELFQPEQSLSGTSYGASLANSTLRFTVAQGGIYRFALGASSGRFQLRVNETALRKVITPTGADFSAFLPAGTHSLVVDQDSTEDSAWNVLIAPTELLTDSLPYARGGLTLGGGGNDFRDEWLPIQLEAATPVNIRVAATGGGPSDSLRVELYAVGVEAPTFSAATVFRDEVFWATTAMPAGTSLLRVSAADGNSAPMEYQIEIADVGVIPGNWSGVARGDGLSSSVTLEAPVDGVYSVVLGLSSGAGQVIVDGAGSTVPTTIVVPAATLNDTSLTLRVPLSAGAHRFSFEQDRAQPSSGWQIAVSLLRNAVALTVDQVSPGLLAIGEASEIEIIGAGFESGTSAALINAAGQAVPTSQVVVSSTRILLNLPADTPRGVYDLRLSNPNGTTVSRAAALVIGSLRLYLPLLSQ